MATMAISTKTRSVGALLLLVAVLVGTCAPGVHATDDKTLIINDCKTNVSVAVILNVTLPVLGSLPAFLLDNVTVGANATALLPFLLNIGAQGVVATIGGNETITLPTATLLSDLSVNLGLFGGLIAGSITSVTFNCSVPSCGTPGLVAPNTSVTVTDTLGISASICV